MSLERSSDQENVDQGAIDQGTSGHGVSGHGTADHGVTGQAQRFSGIRAGFYEDAIHEEIPVHEEIPALSRLTSPSASDIQSPESADLVTAVKDPTKSDDDMLVIDGIRVDAGVEPSVFDSDRPGELGAADLSDEVLVVDDSDVGTVADLPASQLEAHPSQDDQLVILDEPADGNLVDDDAEDSSSGRSEAENSSADYNSLEEKSLECSALEYSALEYRVRSSSETEATIIDVVFGGNTGRHETELAAGHDVETYDVVPLARQLEEADRLDQPSPATVEETSFFQAEAESADELSTDKTSQSQAPNQTPEAPVIDIVEGADSVEGTEDGMFGDSEVIEPKIDELTRVVKDQNEVEFAAIRTRQVLVDDQAFVDETGGDCTSASPPQPDAELVEADGEPIELEVELLEDASEVTGRHDVDLPQGLSSTSSSVSSFPQVKSDTSELCLVDDQSMEELDQQGDDWFRGNRPTVQLVDSHFEGKNTTRIHEILFPDHEIKPELTPTTDRWFEESPFSSPRLEGEGRVPSTRPRRVPVDNDASLIRSYQRPLAVVVAGLAVAGAMLGLVVGRNQGPPAPSPPVLVNDVDIPVNTIDIGADAEPEGPVLDEAKPEATVPASDTTPDPPSEPEVAEPEKQPTAPTPTSKKPASDTKAGSSTAGDGSNQPAQPGPESTGGAAPGTPKAPAQPPAEQPVQVSPSEPSGSGDANGAASGQGQEIDGSSDSVEEANSSTSDTQNP